MPEAAPWQFKTIKTVPDRKPRPEMTVLKGRIFTGTSEGVIEDGFVKVEGTMITAVGAASDLGSGADGAYVLGGPGKTVLPGLFNNHAHLAWDGANDLATQSLEDSPEISAYKAASNMIRSLGAGVTTVRDLGMNKSNLVAKQAVAQGIFRGPKLLVCGEAIVQTGGHTYWCCREASGADEMRRAVREQVRGGADLIKIMACHDLLEFTDEELHAVIDETHRNGLRMTAHATFDAAINRMLKFGVDVIEHGGSLSEETIQLLLDTKTFIVTTFAPVVMQAQEGAKWGLPEWKIQERIKQRNDAARYDGLVKAAAAGVRIVFGTDAGSPVVPHDVIAPELKFMVELGVMPDNEAALHCITSQPAVMNQLEKDRGSLAAGLAGDVIVVDGNPLEDLDALESVESVLLDGRHMV